MSDALSLAANVSGIIGLGDVVFRAGRELYDLCRRCQDAPASKASLLAEISASISVVVQCRIFLDEHRSASEDSGDSLPEIRTFLTLLGQEFNLLCEIMRKSQSSAAVGWFGQLSRNFRWSLEESTVAQSCNRLHRLTSSMNMALSVTARRHDVVVRREISVTQNEVTKLAEHIPVAIQSAIETTLNASMSTLLSAASSSPPTPPRSSGLRRPAAPGLTKSRQRTKLACSHRGHMTRDSALPNPGFAINESPSTTETILLREHVDQSIQMESPIYNDVTVPLTMMKAALRAALGSSKSLILSKENAFFIGSIVDELLAEAHLASARRLGQKFSQRQSQSLDSNAATAGLELDVSSVPWMGRSNLRLPGLETELRDQMDFCWDSSLVLSQEFSKKTPWGILRAHLELGGNPSRSEVRLFDFDFVPKADLLDSGVTISFLSSRRLLPRLITCIIAYNMDVYGEAWIFCWVAKLDQPQPEACVNVGGATRIENPTDIDSAIGNLLGGVSVSTLQRRLSCSSTCSNAVTCLQPLRLADSVHLKGTETMRLLTE